MLFRLYQMLLVYTPFKVGPSRPAWDRGREQRRSSKPDWMNSGSSISINKEVDQGNKRWFSDCSRRGKFLSTNKHDHTSLHPCRKVPHCWIFFAKSCGKERIIMTAVVSALCAFVWLSPTLSQTDTQTCSTLWQIESKSRRQRHKPVTMSRVPTSRSARCHWLLDTNHHLKVDTKKISRTELPTSTIRKWAKGRFSVDTHFYWVICLLWLKRITLAWLCRSCCITLKSLIPSVSCAERHYKQGKNSHFTINKSTTPGSKLIAFKIGSDFILLEMCLNTQGFTIWGHNLVAIAKFADEA